MLPGYKVPFRELVLTSRARARHGQRVEPKTRGYQPRPKKPFIKFTLMSGTERLVSFPPLPKTGPRAQRARPVGPSRHERRFISHGQSYLTVSSTLIEPRVIPVPFGNLARPKALRTHRAHQAARPDPKTKLSFWEPHIPVSRCLTPSFVSIRPRLATLPDRRLYRTTGPTKRPVPPENQTFFLGTSYFSFPMPHAKFRVNPTPFGRVFKNYDSSKF